jgi:hypothetical protein
MFVYRFPAFMDGEFLDSIILPPSVAVIDQPFFDPSPHFP